VFNAANEECVEAFLVGAIPFLAIVDTVARVVDEWAGGGQEGNDPAGLSVESVLRAEAWARARAREVLGLVGRESEKR
jgi:1-deoxy-D-xylulose-5-phosphate reductoisomerase